jgi:hypothetical protein
MKITEDVRKYAAEQGLTNEEALESGMQAVTRNGFEETAGLSNAQQRPGFPKRKEFAERGAELYAKA